MSTLASESLNPETLDLSFLRGTVQPQHLSPDAIRAAREAFSSHPAHIARLQNFLEPQVAERLGRALASEVAYGRIRHLYSSDNLNVSEDAFLAADPSDRMLQFSQMDGVREGITLSPNIMQLMKFRQIWHDPRFAAYLSAMTGLNLEAPSSFVANSLGAGDFINPHNDVVHERKRRRLAFIVYLNPNWQPAFGGDLHITSWKGEKSVWPVEYNSFAFFDVHGHKDHEVALVEAAAGEERRNSFNGWFSEKA
jgi:Rps23 Pro-64 3,4-dihydroxylase Tpa1-like proline 4-hydroxylase